MRMQVILESLFARPGSAPNEAGRKENSGTGLMESGFVDDSYHCLLHSSSHPQHVKNKCHFILSISQTETPLQ